MALLDVANLTAAYGQAQVLFGVSLTLGPGEVAALMGRNGAGKSSTLKAVMGLLAPLGGEGTVPLPLVEPQRVPLGLAVSYEDETGHG